MTKRLGGMAPIIIVLFIIFTASAGFGIYAGSNPQNEKAVLAVLDILTSETTETIAAVSPVTVVTTGLAGNAADGVVPAETETGETKNDTLQTSEGYYFVYNDVNIELGRPVAGIVDELGQARDFYSYPSCAFAGDEKTYVYDGFEITTYMRYVGDTDRIYSLVFWDDSVATIEGLRIGDSYEEMVAAYGTEYEEIPGCYVYVREGIALSFSLQDKVIVSITYFVEDIRKYGV
jgi:hypothetical protein